MRAETVRDEGSWRQDVRLGAAIGALAALGLVVAAALHVSGLGIESPARLPLAFLVFAAIGAAALRGSAWLIDAVTGSVRRRRPPTAATDVVIDLREPAGLEAVDPARRSLDASRN